MAKFSVNGVITQISETILNKYLDSYLTILSKLSKNSTIPVDKFEDSIIVEEDNEIFDKIVMVYKYGLQSLPIFDKTFIEKLRFYGVLDNIVPMVNKYATNIGVVNDLQKAKLKEELKNIGLDICKVDEFLIKTNATMSGPLVLKSFYFQEWKTIGSMALPLVEISMSESFAQFVNDDGIPNNVVPHIFNNSRYDNDDPYLSGSNNFVRAVINKICSLFYLKQNSKIWIYTLEKNDSLMSFKVFGDGMICLMDLHIKKNDYIVSNNLHKLCYYDGYNFISREDKTEKLQNSYDTVLSYDDIAVFRDKISLIQQNQINYIDSIVELFVSLTSSKVREYVGKLKQDRRNKFGINPSSTSSIKPGSLLFDDDMMAINYLLNGIRCDIGPITLEKAQRMIIKLCCIENISSQYFVAHTVPFHNLITPFQEGISFVARFDY
ncbi:hypothetical protein Catovirus_1_645 [Catovirus CTV1]|uniref:Uncharacterized protein n=1 Tax=Catovirus CTV1 TaxID=1977631 RepID=A0A1V0SA50_9VIRU|nr:hypothetical protein Catovirus_1_645 [Catovirus CTV1]